MIAPFNNRRGGVTSACDAKRFTSTKRGQNRNRRKIVWKRVRPIICKSVNSHAQEKRRRRQQKGRGAAPAGPTMRMRGENADNVLCLESNSFPTKHLPLSHSPLLFHATPHKREPAGRAIEGTGRPCTKGDLEPPLSSAGLIGWMIPSQKAV